ncbi:RHS repeat-associated core domain-containing protein [Rhizobacter sp. OV335]|nr:RHS repeat-associated core domain-containing protein [Rhizobacter sp. OV335]
MRAYEYDAEGNVTKITRDPGGLNVQTRVGYDAQYRVKELTDPKNGKTAIEYDGGGRPTKVTDPRNLVTQYPRNGFGDATQLISPDTGITNITYDAARRLKTRTDSRGVTETYTYDLEGRLTSVGYAQSGQPSQTITWNWDLTGPDYTYSIGRLSRTDHPSGFARVKYDPRGRITEAVQSVNAKAGANTVPIVTTVKYAYSHGDLMTITYPSGRVLVITRDVGELIAMSLAKDAGSTPIPLISNVKWEPFGPVSGWDWHMTSGLVPHMRQFDLSGRIVRYPLGNVLRDVTYDAADRITDFTHLLASDGTAQPALDQSFGYDENSQLTSITTAASSWSIAYDPNGNRTSVSLNGSPSTYTTEATSNRLTSLTNPARSFGYDNAGNTTSDSANYTATYGLNGAITSITKAGVTGSYDYDAKRRRIRKVTSTGETVIFVYDLEGQLLGEYDQTGKALREYVWLDNIPVAMFMPDPTNASPSAAPLVFYIHADHLNAPRIVVDRNGAKRWRWLAEPFGTTAPETNPDGLGAFGQNLRFPGQYADAESGLFYNYFRSYDGSRGGYSQADPSGLRGGINGYAYVSGDPLNYVDPNGLASCKWTWFALVCEYGSPPVVDPDYPSMTPQSASWPAFRNPFEGIFAASRPKGMSPLEERQWDRHCQNAGDPCLALKAAAQQAIAAARVKMNNMLQDPSKLFTLAYDVPNRALTGTSTTWVGHRPGLQGMIDNINAMISLGQRMGCDMTAEIIASSTLYIPNAPLTP